MRHLILKGTHRELLLINMAYLQFLRHFGQHNDQRCKWTWRRLQERTRVEWQRPDDPPERVKA